MWVVVLLGIVIILTRRINIKSKLIMCSLVLTLMLIPVKNNPKVTDDITSSLKDIKTRLVTQIIKDI